MRVETAIKMIENHGHKAFVTAEGLACVSQGVIATLERNAQDIAFADDDFVFEEVTTLPVSYLEAAPSGAGIRGFMQPGRYDVDANDVRNWLGY